MAISLPSKKGCFKREVKTKCHFINYEHVCLELSKFQQKYPNVEFTIKN
jgi:hypothetical protein